MIRACLFPTDFSSLASTVAPIAAEYVLALGGELHVVHADQFALAVTHESPAHTTGIAPPSVESSDPSALLEQFCAAHFGSLSESLVTAVLNGRPNEVIPRYAVEHSIDLLIVPTHADGVMKRLLLGSVSKSILESSPCPVLMIPAGCVDEGDQLSLVPSG